MHRSTTPTIRSAPPTSGAVTKSSVETCHTDLRAHTSMSVSNLIHHAPALRCCAPSDLRPLSTASTLHAARMTTCCRLSSASTAARGGDL